MMESLENHNRPKKRLNKMHFVGILIGLLAVAAFVFYLLQTPSQEEQIAAILEGSYKEGTPEFAAITRDILISTDPDTVQSPNAFGAISMFIKGTISNKSDKVINGLEVNVAVVDSFDETIKEKRVLVVPRQRDVLRPNEDIPVTLSVDGFKPEDDRANIRWKVTAIRVAE